MHKLDINLKKRHKADDTAHQEAMLEMYVAAVMSDIHNGRLTMPYNGRLNSADPELLEDNGCRQA